MTTRRRLLFYTHALAGGGAERVLARLASGFAARGDEVMFVVDFEASENLAQLRDDVELCVLPRGHARAIAGLAGLLRRRRPDVSVSALAVSNFKHAAAAALAGRLARAVIGYHGFSASEPGRLSRLGYQATPLISRLCGATVAVTNALRDDLVQRFHVPPGRIVTIYNPAAPTPFPEETTAARIAARAPVVLALGRLVSDKDFETLIRAFAQLDAPDARLAILGEGPERARLGALARDLGVATRLDMPGYVDDIAAQLSRASCLVVSSRHESFGLSCVEGLAHGLPVITTDCGGPAEVLGSAGFGPPVAVGDAPALAAQIATALHDPGAPTPRQARARVFSLDAALDAHDRLFRTLPRRSS